MAVTSEPTLLGLPSELRNQIYDRVLHLHQIATNGVPDIVFPAITKVNRQTRNEALPMYLGEYLEVDLGDFDIWKKERESKPEFYWYRPAYFRTLNSLTPEVRGLLRKTTFSVGFKTTMESHHCHSLQLKITDKTVGMIRTGCVVSGREYLCECDMMSFKVVVETMLASMRSDSEGDTRYPEFVGALGRKVRKWYVGRYAFGY